MTKKNPKSNTKTAKIVQIDEETQKKPQFKKRRETAALSGKNIRKRQPNFLHNHELSIKSISFNLISTDV